MTLVFPNFRPKTRLTENRRFWIMADFDIEKLLKQINELTAELNAAKKYGLTPIARFMGGAAAGVPPRVMGIGPAPASRKLIALLSLTVDQFDVIELNEAFASQGLATLRELGVADDDARVNPNGGAIALGHPLGMSGARIAGTAALELSLRQGKYALATMCIGVGQGIAVALERV